VSRVPAIADPGQAPPAVAGGADRAIRAVQHDDQRREVREEQAGGDRQVAAVESMEITPPE
jgi:hypothetical protein